MLGTTAIQVAPDHYTYNTAISACETGANYPLANHILAQMANRDVTPTVATWQLFLLEVQTVFRISRLCSLFNFQRSVRGTRHMEMLGSFYFVNEIV